MAAVLGCGGVGPDSGRVWHVDEVGEARARMVEAASEQVRMVDRSALPPGTREGDVVVDGRLDPELRARLTREVAEVRARRAVPLPPGLDLAGSEAPRLTSPGEE